MFSGVLGMGAGHSRSTGRPPFRQRFRLLFQFRLQLMCLVLFRFLVLHGLSILNGGDGRN